eukprot:6299436-Pyramimonas_sp.AAC.1
MGDASVEAGQLVDSLKVTEVPTIILFSAGVEVDRVVGTDPMEVASHILKVFNQPSTTGLFGGVRPV